jgi:hypothetical protein
MSLPILHYKNSNKDEVASIAPKYGHSERVCDRRIF